MYYFTNIYFSANMSPSTNMCSSNNIHYSKIILIQCIVQHNAYYAKNYL